MPRPGTEDCEPRRAGAALLLLLPPQQALLRLTALAHAVEVCPPKAALLPRLRGGQLATPRVAVAQGVCLAAALLAWPGPVQSEGHLQGPGERQCHWHGLAWLPCWAQGGRRHNRQHYVIMAVLCLILCYYDHIMQIVMAI